MILFVAGRTVGAILGDFGCAVFAGVPTLYVATFLSLFFVTGIAETKAAADFSSTLLACLHRYYSLLSELTINFPSGLVQSVNRHHVGVNVKRRSLGN